ncbi:MAG: hypothetical protein KDJ44_09160 [Rhodoblastus sp.]|nr:hypothetical protein [Rhodoblastus sp.]
MADAIRMEAGETSAVFCRRMGWKEGDKIESPTEGAHSVLEIITLHDHVVRAREIAWNGNPLKSPQVCSWALSYRAWRAVQ